MRVTKVLHFLFLLLIVGSCSSELQFTHISGDISSASGSMAYVSVCVNGAMEAVDSCRVKQNGRFNLKCQIDICEVVEVSFSEGFERIGLVVKPGEAVEIVQEGISYRIAGSAESMQLLVLQNYFAGLNGEIAKLTNNLNDSTSLNNKYIIQSNIDSLLGCARERAVSFIADNPYSLTSMMLLNIKLDSVNRLLPYNQFRAYYCKVDSCLIDVLPDNFAVGQFGDIVRKFEARYKAQSTAAHYEENDVIPALEIDLIDGKKIIVPGVWSRFVLLDFSADWNGKKPLQNFDEVYSTYSKRGFQIVQVISTIDEKKAKTALLADSLQWFCSLITDPVDCSIIKTLGIVEFPCNYLINRRGTVVAKNIYGKDLMDFLEQGLRPIVRLPKPDTAQRRVVPTMILKPISPIVTLNDSVSVD